MLVKIHESYRKVVAVCDDELVGEKFEEGKRQLDVRERFYKGDDVDGDKLVLLLQDLARDDSTFNIVGEKSVEAALAAGIIMEENVGEVDGVKFALVLV